MVLNIYGGASSPTVANAWQRSVLFDQLLAQEGYVVIKVDNRAATAINKRLENTVMVRLASPKQKIWLTRQSG